MKSQMGIFGEGRTHTSKIQLIWTFISVKGWLILLWFNILTPLKMCMLHVWAITNNIYLFHNWMGKILKLFSEKVDVWVRVSVFCKDNFKVEMLKCTVVWSTLHIHSTEVSVFHSWAELVSTFSLQVVYCSDFTYIRVTEFVFLWSYLTPNKNK